LASSVDAISFTKTDVKSFHSNSTVAPKDDAIDFASDSIFSFVLARTSSSKDLIVPSNIALCAIIL
jgi:hypothetical protein